MTPTVLYEVRVGNTNCLPSSFKRCLLVCSSSPDSTVSSRACLLPAADVEEETVRQYGENMEQVNTQLHTKAKKL